MHHGLLQCGAGSLKDKHSISFGFLGSQGNKYCITCAVVPEGVLCVCA